MTATALGADIAKADEALAALESSSDPAAREAPARALPQLVSRESAAITRAAAAVGEMERLRAVEKELETVRREAWENLVQFGGRRIPGGSKAKADAVEAAHRHNDRLGAIEARLRPAYAAQVQLAEAAVRRGRRLDQLRRIAPAAGKALGEDEESARLAGTIESALGGMPPELLAGFEPDPRDPPPADAGRRCLWHYLACRRIEAYNRPLEAALLDPQEVQHARLLNAYRERLGVLPLELDARLVQSARRHSREMIDGWYFSHYSPTESLRTWSQRMRAAGYDRPADENLHFGRYEGAASFWRLFDSPGHHWAMTRPQYTSLGVGRWDLAWTEDFGADARLMTATLGGAVKGDRPRRRPRPSARDAAKTAQPGGLPAAEDLRPVRARAGHRGRPGTDDRPHGSAGAHDWNCPTTIQASTWILELSRTIKPNRRRGDDGDSQEGRR